MISVTEIVQKSRNIFSKKPFYDVYLVGSYADGKATEQSDIDFVVDFDETKIKSLRELDEVAINLEKTFGKRVHLLFQDMGLTFKNKIRIY